MSDIKQAAERLRRYIKGDGDVAIYGEHLEETLEQLFNNDNHTLALAWLELHQPDDDEPVTEEWLETLQSESLKVNLEEDGIGIFGSNGDLQFTNMSDKPITRGQVRQLVRCLTGETK